MPDNVPVLDYANARSQMAAAIVAFMRGEIDNFAFDDAVWAAAEADPKSRVIARTLWLLYDDVKRHPVRVGRPGWQSLRRCVAFLLTPEPVLEPSDGRTDASTLWPFGSWASVRAAAPVLASVDLPAYDPAVHGRPVRARDVAIGNGWYWIAGALLLLLVAALAFGVAGGPAAVPGPDAVRCPGRRSVGVPASRVPHVRSEPSP